MWVIKQHPYIWGVRVGTFNVAQPWIVGLNGELQSWQLRLGRAIGSVVDR